MKILYDHQIFTLQKYGGISRYFTQIISNLPKEVRAILEIKYSNNVYLKNYDPEILDYPIERFLPKINFKGKFHVFNFIERLKNNPPPEIINKNLSIELLKNQDFDIFHPTYYDDYFLDYIGEKPFVLTIHDMIHEKYPELALDTKLISQKAKLAERATHIIAVSQNTKNDIIEILNINESKISVIHHASSLVKSDTTDSLKLPEEYFLFVGERGSYKNFLFFIFAVQPLLQIRKKLNVVCTGRDFSIEEQYLLKELELDKQFLHLFVKEENIFELYHKAKAFIFPSYYEGFGIPILEAFEAECPVILSNSSCFEEIALDAALYFEPKNKTQFFSALEEVLDNPICRQTLIEKGKIRLKSFSWKNSAIQTTDIYKKILYQTKQ